MTEKNAFRAMAVAGIVFAVIFALSIFALGGDTPGEKASADEVVSSYQDDKNQHLIAVFLLVAAVVFLPFFAAALKEPFRGAGRAAEALAGVAFAGSVVCVAGILGMIVKNRMAGRRVRRM